MRTSSPWESSRSLPMYLYASDGSLYASVTRVIAAQNKAIASAVSVMSSPVVPRDRGQECHSQPSCSAAVPGEKHKSTRDNSRRKRNTSGWRLSPSYRPQIHFSAPSPFSRPPGTSDRSLLFCFLFFFLISSQLRTPPLPRNPNQRLLCGKSYRSCDNCTCL